MAVKNYMTPIGKSLLEAELKNLIQKERPSIVKALEDAIDHGDYRENAEFQTAKERQSFIEGRIAEINEKLARAVIIDPKTIKSSHVAFGAHVTIEDQDTGTQKTYQIVGDDESDIKQNKLNYMSPLARLLIGKSEGDEVEFNNGRDTKIFAIKKVCFRS